MSVVTQALRNSHLTRLIHSLHTLWKQRELILQFARREVEGRYRGSFLGLLWSFANPLFMLAIYTFVFGVVLQSRWPQARTSSLSEFALIVFAGLTAFNLFSECVNRAPHLVVGVPNYVKKVVFPLEILPISTLIAALFHTGISLIVLLCVEILLLGGFPWTVILLPIILIPLIFLNLGCMWFLASIGVFIRDIGQAIGILTQALFFFTPIFYSIEAIPEPFHTLILYNPVAPVVENFRRILIWEQMPSWRGVILWTLATALFMLTGYVWFMKTKKAFADVI